MKTLRKKEEKKVIKNFKALKVEYLQQIKGGEGAPTQKVSDFD
jgi:hypothetical protein